MYRADETPHLMRLNLGLQKLFGNVQFSLFGEELSAREAFHDEIGLPLVVASAYRLFRFVHPDSELSRIPVALEPSPNTLVGLRVRLYEGASIAEFVMFMDDAVRQSIQMVDGRPVCALDPFVSDLQHQVDVFAKSESPERAASRDAAPTL